MDNLIWMRPARDPVRPCDIEELSSPARRVLESLESRYGPAYPPVRITSYQDLPVRGQGQGQFVPFNNPSTSLQTVPFINPSSAAPLSQWPQPLVQSLWSQLQGAQPQSHSMWSQPQRAQPESHSMWSKPRGSPRPVGDNVLADTERQSTLQKNVDNEPINDHSPTTELDTSLPISSYDIFDEEFASASFRVSPGNKSLVSAYDIFSQELTGNAARMSPDSPPMSTYSAITFDDEAMKSFNDDAATCPGSPLSNREITEDDLENSERLENERCNNSGDLLEQMYSEADKENRKKLGGIRFNNSGDLMEHICSTLRKESSENAETSLYGSPFKDITKSLNNTNTKKMPDEKNLLFVKETPLSGCKSPQIDRRQLSIKPRSLFTSSPSSINIMHINSAPAVSPQPSKEILDSSLLDFSFDDSFDTATVQKNVSAEKSLQYPVIDKSPMMAESSNGKITPKTKKKFLGTSFQRALSSNRISPKVSLDEIPHPSTEVTSSLITEQKENEIDQATSAQNGESCPPLQIEGPHEKVSEEPPTLLFPIFMAQSKRKSDKIENSQEKSSCKKRLKFVVPYKRNQEQSVEAPSSHKDIRALSLKLSKEINSRRPKMQNLTEILAQDISQKIVTDSPEEISITLQYRGGFCQLNRSNNGGTLCPENILIRIMWSSDIRYMSIPIQNYSWSSALVKVIFQDRSRKVCFEAQEMIQLMMDKFGFSASEVSSHWVILDPLIGCWLINPDEPPDSFKNVMTMLKISQETDGLESLLSKLSETAKVLYEQLTKSGLWKLFLHIEMHITPILACMELHGIQIDVKKFQDMGTLLKNRLEDIQKSAFKAAGRQFQLTSPQQLGNVMYDHLKLDVKHNISVKETDKKHNKSTSEPTLNLFKDLHPLPRVMLEFRRLHKLKSTYVDPMIGQVSGNSIYTTWDQTSAATGRITSSEPNLQTIPKHPLLPDQPELLLRAAFVAREGFSFLAADFQHIELRVFAHLSKDTALIRALSQATDVFKILSQKWLQIEDISQVSEEDRDKTKRIMYALMYGAGASKLMEFLHVDQNQANEILRKFSGTFTKMEEFSKSVIRDCRSRGYLTTETGRRRLFPNIKSNNFQQRMYSERQAVNFLVQGTAADLCKCAMVQTQRHLAGMGSDRSIPQARLLLQIHDELLWEIPDAEVADAADIVQSAMEGATSAFQCFSNFSVPLPVVMKIGKSWGDLKTVKKVSLGIASQQTQ